MELENVDATPQDGSQNTETQESPNIEQVDNVQQVREWGKNWEKSAKGYEPAHKFITERFGDLSQAEVAHRLYSNLFNDDFNPENFIKTVSEISPKRSELLVENFAKDKAQSLVPKALEELFGSTPSKEEIAMFQEWRQNGMFGKGEDLPDFLLIDQDGNPRTDEEIEWFRNLKKQSEQALKLTEQQRVERENALRTQQEQAIEASVEEFTTGSLAVLEPDFEAYGLAFAPNDTTEVKAQKQIQRDFIIGGIKELFLKDKKGLQAYTSAIEHIQNGEKLLARRYEPQIKQSLLSALRGKPLEALLNGLKSSAPPAGRTEIPNSESPTPKLQTTGDKFDRESRIQELFKQGLLKED